MNKTVKEQDAFVTTPLISFLTLVAVSVFVLSVYIAVRIAILEIFFPAPQDIPSMSVLPKASVLAATVLVPVILQIIAALVGTKWQRSKGWRGLDRSKFFVYRFGLGMHLVFAVSLIVISALAFISFEALNELAGREYFIVSDIAIFIPLIFFNFHIWGDWIIFLRHHRI